MRCRKKESRRLSVADQSDDVYGGLQVDESPVIAPMIDAADEMSCGTAAERQVKQRRVSPRRRSDSCRQLSDCVARLRLSDKVRSLARYTSPMLEHSNSRFESIRFVMRIESNLFVS